ncbi:MAG: hypothetical protein D6748_06600 [Calditrichaeota bacterium]|nr:MAG: hypothetical protein D6748_06600 [Calditrichota bacterium]
MKAWIKYLPGYFLVFVLISGVFAQDIPVNDNSDFTGIYQGKINNTPAILEIDVYDDEFDGDIEAGEEEFALEGVISGNKVSGAWYDEKSEEGRKFTAILKGDNLTIVLHNAGKKKEFHFYRQTQAQEQEPGETGNVSIGDRRLIGVWAKQEIISSGGATVASQVFLYINSDGTFRYGDARTMAGGANWSGSVGGSETTSGRWRSKNGVFQVMLDGTSQWIPLAKYYLQPGKLLFNGFDGSRELWYRQY